MNGQNTQTPEQWLEEQFEFEYCAECGGDAEHHTVVGVPGIGTPFARCDYPPSAETDWEQHPVIVAFHKELDKPSASIRCDQCEATMINGVFCHETGCPNSRKTYEDGEWVLYRECHECGCDVRDGEACDCMDTSDMCDCCGDPCTGNYCEDCKASEAEDR